MIENALGVMSITNTLALYLIEIEYDVNDKAVFRFSNETKDRKAKLYTNAKGESFFKIRGQRYYLKDFMKVGGM